MAHYVWMVLTNATPGTDAAFNRWYQQEHIPDLLRVPGVLSAQRFKVTPRQMVNVNGALAMVVHSCELGNGNYWAREVIRRAYSLFQQWRREVEKKE